MKFVKIISSLIISFCLLFSVCLSLKAEEEFDFDKEVIKTYQEVTNQEIGAGVNLYQYEATAYNDGIIDENRLNDYVVSWLDYGSNTNVRIVNWCYTGIENFSEATASQLAKNYEKANPGYLVMGAINGDFFRIDDSGEVKNLSVKEGEMYKPYIWQSTGLGVLGWSYDGKIIDGTPSISPNMYLETLDQDEKVIKETTITSVNQCISDTGISLITKDVDVEGGTKYNLEGCTVVAVKYDIHRYSLDGYGPNGENEGNILFVKGEAESIKNDLGNEGIIPNGYVYLVAKDESLDYVQVGDYLRMQYHLTGDWSNVCNTTGYYSKILENGNSLFYQSAYNDYSHLEADKFYINCKKNRTVIGERSDGSTVLMTIEYDKLGNYGASYYECAEYLKSVGCVNGWLLDGGGSTTLSIRSQSGNFEMIAGGSDGHERRNGNAILLVVKDPGIRPRVSSLSRFSAELTIDQTGSIFSKDVYDISLTVNGVTKVFENKPLAFDNLQENTEYVATIRYKMKMEDGSVFEGKLYRSFKTAAFTAPNISISLNQASNTEVILKKEVRSSLDGFTISNEQVHIGENIYQFNQNNFAVCNNLKPNTLYEPYITYDVYEYATGNTYHITGNSIIVSTKIEAIPTLVSFYLTRHGGTKVEFAYEFHDPENKVTDAYIKYVPYLTNLSSNQGLVIIENIDVTLQSYEFSLVLEYDGKIIESEIITLEQQSTLPDAFDEEVEEEKQSKCGQKNASLFITLFSLLSILYLIRRKK